MYLLLLSFLSIVCAVQVMHTQKLITTAIWLAGVSATTAAMIYLLGAPWVAVIELSVGAGLVTVLFVYAISIAGESTFDPFSVVPKPLAWTLVLIALALMAVQLGLPLPSPEAPYVGGTLRMALWQNRVMDLLLQIPMIFSGVLGMLGIMTSALQPTEEAHRTVVQRQASAQIAEELQDEVAAHSQPESASLPGKLAKEARP